MPAAQAPPVRGYLWRSMLAWGVITVILGVVVLVWPDESIVVASALFGAYLLVSGIAQLVLASRSAVPVGSRALLLISGALSIVLGVLAFRHFGQGYATLLLAIWIGVSFLFQGTSETTLAISDPDLPARGWHIFLGVISLIAGVVVLAWPFDSVSVLALVAGVWLVAIGIAQIIWSFQARRALDSAQPGVQRMTHAAA